MKRRTFDQLLDDLGRAYYTLGVESAQANAPGSDVDGATAKTVAAREALVQALRKAGLPPGAVAA